ncbi:MAG: Pr6Pr family membrane protein [Ferruginibacter sp.]
MFSKTSRLFATCIAIIAWSTVMMQLYININLKLNPLSETLIRFFSYFTVLTNILVAVCCTAIATGSKKFFSRPATICAVAVYISIVGIIYNVILRNLWHPTGTQKIVDELLHVVVPVLFILFWLLLVPKNMLQWKNAFPWLLYPLIYLIAVMCRGSFSGFYPYPFLDLSLSAFQQVLLNCCMICAAFLFISLLFIWIAKLTSKK